jgi:uncharacterized protein YndB with AHSA1/START domain
MNTDLIEKKILVRAPIARVWQALADSTAFGTWFGMKFDGPFVPGATLHGVIVGTAVDADVANQQRQHHGKPFDIRIEEMEPQRLFSFRWHPYAVDAGVDYSKEPMTLVAFRLDEQSEGVLVTVTESGFDQIPLERRAKAFAANEGGWNIMITMMERYLTTPAVSKAQ